MQPGILSRSTSVPQNVLKKTTGVSHFYCYPETGNDANDGLSESTPKKSLEAIFAVMPERLEHGTWLHLGPGDFDLTGLSFVGLMKYVNISKRLLISGHDSVVELAGPWAADVHSETEIGNTGLSLTPNQYFGKWIEIIDGPLAGEQRAIHGHDGTTFVPSKGFSGDPGAAQFRIVRPATRVTASAGVPSLLIGCSGGEVALYNIYFDGVVNFRDDYTDYLTIDACIFDCKYFSSVGGERLYLNDWHYLPDNSYVYSNKLPTINQATGEAYIIETGNVIMMGQFGANGIMRSGGLTVGMDKGSISLGKIRLINARMQGSSAFKTSVGYAKTEIINNAGVGMKLEKSHIAAGDGFDISGCSSHGLELIGSILECKNTITGSGNTGAGIHAHMGSHVRTAAGSPPTVTGSVGDISVDGTTQISTWAAVEAGTPVADTTEMVTVRKQ